MSNIDYINRPCQYAIYKGIKSTNSAVQFNLSRFDPVRAAQFEDRKTQEKEKKGHLLIDMAPACGPNQYDWDKDIKFSMTEVDMAQFVTGTASMKEQGETCVELVHKLEKEGASITKSLKLVQGGEYRGEPTWMLQMSSTEGGGRRCSMPISRSELWTIRTLFEAAVPVILGWGI